MSTISISSALTGLAAATFFTVKAEAAAPRLLVFVHAAVKQRALEGELTRALPGVTVTAVGRIGDFDRALAQGQDAVLALPQVLSARGLSPALHGRRGDSLTEPYGLISADVAPDPTRVGSVGALDFLGREGTTSFVESLVGHRVKVERVTKVEDLLPLLQIGRVEAILLPLRLLPDLRSASRLNLLARELPRAVDLVSVASLGPASTAIFGLLQKLPRSLSLILGVDSWH